MPVKANQVPFQFWLGLLPGLHPDIVLRNLPAPRSPLLPALDEKFSKNSLLLIFSRVNLLGDFFIKKKKCIPFHILDAQFARTI